jgi:hypothetical protein
MFILIVHQSPEVCLKTSYCVSASGGLIHYSQLHLIKGHLDVSSLQSSCYEIDLSSTTPGERPCLTSASPSHLPIEADWLTAAFVFKLYRAQLVQYSISSINILLYGSRSSIVKNCILLLVSA